MQVELEIKKILSSQVSVDCKINEIQKFMKWDRNKLMGSITKHGISSPERINSVINEFWEKDKKSNGRCRR